MLSAFITGCAGPELSADERYLFDQVRPAGLILFERNCRTPDQVRRLVDSFRDTVGSSNLLVLIDQEGGRVQRMKPPEWRQLPAAAAFQALYLRDRASGVRAAQLASRLVARELALHGINMNCAPVLDLPVAGAHGIIGNRAYGEDVETVVALGRAVAEGLLEGGVIPVIKHIPGHGRATHDSHLDLPVISTPLAELEQTDFAPFRALRDKPAAMTAHVVLTAIDPNRPVSTSPEAIARIVRGSIGFEGLLMSDDLSMGALTGDMAARTSAVMTAGCDLALHCNGHFHEMAVVAANVPLLDGKGLQRFDASLAAARPAGAFDASEALEALQAALSVAA